MHPVLITIRGFDVPTFGIIVLVGVFMGIALQKREGARLGYDARKIEELALWTILVSWAGSRLTYVLQNLGEVAANPAGVFASGGYVLYGGVAAGVACAAILARRAGIPAGRLVDIFSPGVTLGFAMGRIGCLCAGCDYGRRAAEAHWWTLTFTDPRCLVPTELLGRPLLPAQPIMCFEHLLTFAIIFPLRRRLTRWPGALLFLTLAIEPPLRFLAEITRGDADRGFIGPLSTSQAIALVVAPVSLALLLWRLSRRPAP